MSTRYDELTKILGTGSAGTPSSTPAAEEQKQTSRRDELYSLLGASEPETPATAATGASTTQSSPALEKPKQETLQQTTTQSAAPSTSSGAYAPPSPQGEGRNAEQIQQEISDSRNRLEQLQLEAAYILTVEPGAELDRQMDAERAKIKALNEELDALKTPNTNAERDSLIQRMNAITENEGYATTVELADAVTQEKQKIRQHLHQLDEELGNAARFYDSGERSGAVIKGALKQTGSAYTNFMGTLQGVGNRLHEASSAADQAVAGSDYAGWATDELTAANMAEAIMKENPDGNYLEGLQKEEQRLYEKADTVAASAAKDIEQAKEGLSTLGQAGVDISTNLIQMGIDAAGRAAGLGMLPLFVRAAGGAMQEARHDGASTGQQFAYGLTKGAIEVGTEKLFDGLAGIFGKGAADDVIDGLIGKLSGSNTGRSLLRAFAGATGEGTEEVISDLLDPFAKLIYNDQALAEAWENREELRSQMLYDYLLGVAMGGFGSVIGAATGQYAEKNAALAEMDGQSQTEEMADAGETPQSAPLTAPLTQGSQNAQTDLPTAAVTQEAQAQAAETADRLPKAELYNMRAGKNGWDKTYGTAQEALGEAVQYVDAELWNAIGKEIDNAEGNKQGLTPMTSAMIAVQEEVRQEQITPMQGAKLLSEIYQQGGAEALKTIYNPKTGNLYDKYIGQAKQYVFQKAAETAQNVQRATPQAETPPTTENAVQAASDALNRQAEMNVQGQEAAEEQNAAPAVYNQTAGQREQTDGANAVRGFSENVATDSAMEEALRREFEQNPEMYTRLANKDTLKKAQEIFSQGLDKARSDLERAIGAAQSGQKLSPEMVPLSRMVANELTRQGELTAARKIISDVAVELTSAGQLGQAGAILRNADPMTVLNTLQKAIDAINAEVGKKFGKRNPWKAELTAEEIKQISETDFSQDGAFEAIQQQIAERLGREMPATWAEKLREIRKVGMLANPKTQVKNVAGNVPLAGERKIAEKLSGGLQELAVKAGIMSKEEQTRTLRVSKESKDLAKSVYENNLDRINRKGNKGELRGLLKDTRTYFNKGLLQKGIEKVTGHQLNDAALDYVRRFTYECLEKGDAPFVKSAFIDSLAQYCEAQGIKTEADVTETAISYAIDQAMAATFKDASALANLLNGIKDKAGIAGQALDVLFPFTTTPINIAKEFGKYSPLGYLQLLNAKGKGTAEVIDIISRATTGSAVVAIGAILRSLGFITGAADDDKDKAAADKAAGISPYSILGKYSYEWMQPTGSALAMGAEIYDSAKDGGSLIETISNGIISAGDAYLEQSFYKDIIDLFQGYGSPTENMIRELLTGTASQFIPTIVGATARTIDPTVRTSYSGGNIIDDILAQAKVKTPGLSKSAPASVNVKGEEIQRGNLLERILDNFLFPWTTNRNGGEENAVDEAINEVYADTADKTIFRQVSPYKVDYGGESYQMTGEEREQFQKTQGQVHDDILQQIIDGTLWQEMDNDAKVKTMQLANEYALDAAKRELVESRGNEYSSDWDDEAELPDVGDYLAAKTTLKAAQDSKDYTLLDALVETVTEQKKDVQEKLNKDFSMLDELIYGKQRGVDAETIYTAKTEADANGNGKISQEELWYYLGLQKNMPEETKDVLWDILTTGKTGYSDYAEKQK